MGFLDSLISLTRALCGTSSQPEPEKPTPFPQHLPVPSQDQRPPQDYQYQQQQQQHDQEHKPHHKKHKHHASGQGQQATGGGGYAGAGGQDAASPVHTSPSPPAHQKYQQQQPHYGGRVDQNMINQQNPHYTSLRAKANDAGDKMARCFNESHQAYESGDGARAKELSVEGKRHKAEMERLNLEASEWIFRENNLDSNPGEIDLHGLYVKEAIAYTDKSIQEARRRGDSEIHLIVGKGLHSPQHVAKLKPAIEQLMQKENLVAALDATNAGVLIIQLDGSQPPADRTRGVLGVDDITKRLDRGAGGDEGCVIM